MLINWTWLRPFPLKYLLSSPNPSQIRSNSNKLSFLTSTEYVPATSLHDWRVKKMKEEDDLKDNCNRLKLLLTTKAQEEQNYMLTAIAKVFQPNTESVPQEDGIGVASCLSSIVSFPENSRCLWIVCNFVSGHQSRTFLFRWQAVERTHSPPLRHHALSSPRSHD